jgi:uncharacterized protein (TIGR03067 family)
MKWLCTFALTLGLLVAADAKDTPADKELKQLQGTWVMVSGEQRGEKSPDQIVKNEVLTIDGNRLTVKLVGVITLSGPCKLGPNEKPQAIDMVDGDGPLQGKTLLGIYELSGEQLKLYFALPGRERPKQFTTRTGTGFVLRVWKRKGRDQLPAIRPCSIAARPASGTDTAV